MFLQSGSQKTTSVYLARWPSNQFCRATAIAYHENYRLCSRKGKHQKSLRAFVPLSAEQRWPQLSEHHISFTRWPRTQNLLISLKIQPALYTWLSALSPSAALCCYGSSLPTMEVILQKEKSIAKMLRACAWSWINIHVATGCWRTALWVSSVAIVHPQITPRINFPLLINKQIPR